MRHLFYSRTTLTYHTVESRVLLDSACLTEKYIRRTSRESKKSPLDCRNPAFYKGSLPSWPVTADNTLTSLWLVRLLFCFPFYTLSIDFEFRLFDSLSQVRNIYDAWINYVDVCCFMSGSLFQGGGGLVQQLRKSYSLSDLTGEKEDENRNTSDMHETDSPGIARYISLNFKYLKNILRSV